MCQKMLTFLDTWPGCRAAGPGWLPLAAAADPGRSWPLPRILAGLPPPAAGPKRLQAVFEAGGGNEAGRRPAAGGTLKYPTKLKNTNLQIYLDIQKYLC